MIDLVAYYAKRNGKALEDGDKRLAVRYSRLEEAERIARSGRLPDRESALLSPRHRVHPPPCGRARRRVRLLRVRRRREVGLLPEVRGALRGLQVRRRVRRP